jgi:transcriptional regulator with XRE-family HTH domain
MKENITHFTRNIIFLRNRINLSRKEVAEKIGIKYTTYTRYENGRAEPSMTTLLDISKFFKVSIDQLMKHKFWEVPLEFAPGDSHDDVSVMESKIEYLQKKLDEAKKKMMSYLADTASVTAQLESSY